MYINGKERIISQEFLRDWETAHPEPEMPGKDRGQELLTHIAWLNDRFMAWKLIQESIVEEV